MKLYGIPNCSTVKKARAWLEARDIAYDFHDFKKLGVPADLMKTLMEIHGWEAMLNRSGTTWRKLDEAQRNACDNADAGIALMLAQPAIIKRPLLDDGKGHALLGFSAEGYQQFISEVTA